ncbi:MAG: response regulator [Desulfobacterales bacterium]|nr:MAG: response regulator [Desulfobacterales bacterium]
MVNERAKILIVDDDRILREVLAEYLADYFEVYVAANNRTAIHWLQSVDIDVVITDIAHPDPNGLALTRLVKSFFEAKVIILSGALDSFYSREECHRAGAVLALRKPQQLSDILDFINKILKKRAKEGM